ncbi:MAG TPA: MnhB domain-containing protein, partial [Solirubrobacteraceae bacterium]|nr:MnhB domain-containing protein [Solirubrobacteraceae bacterium]
MSRRVRLALFALAGTGFAAVLVIAFTGLPDFGAYHGVYGRVIDGVGVGARHATDLVTALNFDIRGFDTLGEEFILFSSVLGVVLILRELRGEEEQPHQEEADEHHFAGASASLRALALALVPSMIALGVYIDVHGHMTPGGGFQAGVILAVGPLAVFIAGRYMRMKLIAPNVLIEIGESLGAAGYGLVGLGGLIFVGMFFKNF